MKQIIIASLAGLAFTKLTFATEAIDLEDITVKSNGLERKESQTTYASEIHTSSQIETSGASTLYDYLAQQSTLNIVPNFGNKATPSINLRGYGGENGYQNVVIMVDGQRLNNIDLSPQLLAGISLGNVERIEISKGSGSVLYGDGATAGAIQIYTKARSGMTVSTSWGNFGQKNHYASAGIAQEKVDLSVNLAHDSHDGFSKQDATGHKDQFTSNSQNAKLTLKPSNSLRLTVQGASSRNDIRYVNGLTLAEFRANPRIAKGRSNHQSFDTNQWQFGMEYSLTPELEFKLAHFNEDKFSEFISSTPSTADYIYKNNLASLRFQNENFSMIAGYQNLDGVRKSSSNFGFGPSQDATTKKNEALYLQTELAINHWRFSAGARDEKVRYRFTPLRNSFSLPLPSSDKQNIDAWDFGANYQFNDQLSMFANISQSHQAPDVDRLFNFGGGFNGIIAPTKVKTQNLGLNYITPQHKLKVSGYYADLKNEIYLVPVVFTNTNLDASHKYGFEIQDTYNINDAWTTGIIYSHTRAIIDHEDIGNGIGNGKELPGVSKHSVVANLNWKFNANANFNLNHAWRSKAYAYNDFLNHFRRKQDAYETTNLSFNYQFQNYSLFAVVNNLFKQENYVQVGDDEGIYPIDFVRTWRIGLKADF